MIQALTIVFLLFCYTLAATVIGAAILSLLGLCLWIQTHQFPRALMQDKTRPSFFLLSDSIPRRIT